MLKLMLKVMVPMMVFLYRSAHSADEDILIP